MAEFWRGGAGPTHADLDRVFDYCDLPVEELSGSKYDRVHAALVQVPEETLPTLLHGLVDLLTEGGIFDADSQWAAEETIVSTADKRLRPFGLHLSLTGVLSGGPASPVASAALSSLPDIHDHIKRIALAIDSTDSALLLGSSKELLETTSKFILAELDRVAPSAFPALISDALMAVGLHPKSVNVEGDLADATRRILGGLLQIGNGVNDLRNAHGTGHGRVNAAKLSVRHARLAAGAATTLATLMIETYEDPSAPWRKAPAPA